MRFEKIVALGFRVTRFGFLCAFSICGSYKGSYRVLESCVGVCRVHENLVQTRSWSDIWV